MKLVVIAHNIRSIYNVGSIFRTSDGFGVDHLYLTGYTPHPEIQHDTRPPHERQRITKQIHKTALGAEHSLNFAYRQDPLPLLARYRTLGYTLAALEQASKSIMLSDYKVIPSKLVLILGEEVQGISTHLLERCDVTLEIPMVGKKESFNVSVATGIALYALTVH